jgi:hypothetical protein
MFQCKVPKLFVSFVPTLVSSVLKKKNLKTKGTKVPIAIGSMKGAKGRTLKNLFSYSPDLSYIGINCLYIVIILKPVDQLFDIEKLFLSKFN